MRSTRVGNASLLFFADTFGIAVWYIFGCHNQFFAVMFDSNAPFPELHTERLLLRQLLPTDRDPIFALRSDPTVNKYIDRDLCTCPDDAGAFIIRMIEHHVRGGGLYWAVCFKGQDNLAGTICLFDYKVEPPQFEMGFEMLPAFQGKGLMQEAAIAVMDHAFHTLNVTNIVATAHRDNHRSANLLNRLGFRYNTEVDDDFIQYVAVR